MRRAETTSMEASENSRPPSHPFVWVPEFVKLGQKRLRSQGRVRGAAILVGIVAGLGAVVFSAACHVVVHYSLDAGAGYRATAPHGEAALPWLSETDHSLRPWLLLIGPTVGRSVSGLF